MSLFVFGSFHFLYMPGRGTRRHSEISFVIITLLLKWYACGELLSVCSEKTRVLLVFRPTHTESQVSAVP